jgi:hypothetical protein
MTSPFAFVSVVAVFRFVLTLALVLILVFLEGIERDFEIGGYEDEEAMGGVKEDAGDAGGMFVKGMITPHSQFRHVSRGVWEIRSLVIFPQALSLQFADPMYVHVHSFFWGWGWFWVLGGGFGVGVVVVVEVRDERVGWWRT